MNANPSSGLSVCGINMCRLGLRPTGRLGSLSFYFAGQQMLLSGDTLFRGGIGRTDLWGGDERAIQSSIRERLFTLDSDTRVIPGHGPSTQIGREREYNPFVGR